MLTAYSEIQNKIQAFDLGADDYLVKPFHLDELHLRIRSLMRRSGTEVIDNEDIISIYNLNINTTKMRITKIGRAKKI